MNQIIQNEDGTIFCAPYLKDGIFNLLIFTSKGLIADYNINSALGLDNSTRPNDNFPHPMMDACFIKDNNLFINVFMTKGLNMYTMIFNFKKQRIAEKPIIIPFQKKAGL